MLVVEGACVPTCRVHLAVARLEAHLLLQHGQLVQELVLSLLHLFDQRLAAQLGLGVVDVESDRLLGLVVVRRRRVDGRERELVALG